MNKQIQNEKKDEKKRDSCDDTTKIPVVCKIHARNKQINLPCLKRLKPCGNLPTLNHISNVIIYRILLSTLAGATVLAFRSEETKQQHQLH